MNISSDSSRVVIIFALSHFENTGRFAFHLGFWRRRDQRRDCAAYQPSQVSFDTARQDGHKTLKERERGGRLGCRRSTEERCLPGIGFAATDRGPAAAGHTTATASALRRQPGLAERLQTEDLLCPRDERGNSVSQGGNRSRVAAVRLQPSIAAAELSRTEGGLGTRGCERYAAQRPPPTTGSWLSIATKS